MRILITGGAGFVGSSIADALLDQGHEVSVVDDLSTGSLSNIATVLSVGDETFDVPRMRFVNGDICDPSTVRGFEPEVIYHLAASYKDRENWERDARTNILGTINVVREAQRVGAKVIYAQTSLCYGPNPSSPISLEAPLDPHGSYAVSKTAGERYIFDSGVEFVSLRLANIFGPRNLSGPIPTFYKRLSEGQPCTVVDSRRDFVFIDDLVEVAVKAATQGRGAYHVSSGRDLSIRDIYWMVVRAMGLSDPEPIMQDRGPDDVATLLLDPSDTLEQFGWSAKTPHFAGIKAAVDFYRAHPPTDTYSHLAGVK